MALAKIYFEPPDASLFAFPPSNEPQTVPPPEAGSFLTAPPFTIPFSIYSAALNVKVPITIACVYAVTVLAVSAYNRSRGNKPWAVSKTKGFFCFVVLHNVFLAVYSAWTFLGMLGAISRTFAPWSGQCGIMGAVDSLCKIHGPQGLGNAVTYNATLRGWISESPSTVLLSDIGTPDSTDVGRLWNEGLAFYGWLFYLSKFYEVLDTLIILAKGKRSSTLQTYHHAGAMMCMWAGMRYMSPPIWLFVFLNSAIHAMMYAYYTLTAFSVKVPQLVKRSLTTMQITQFLVGVTYAGIHYFISYSIPVQVLKSSTSPTLSSISSTATAVASAGYGAVLKKFLLRAAAEEGLAENVGADPASQRASALSHGSSLGNPKYITEYRTVPCIDTSGQTFAIWLNVLYLMPLTVMFVRFFIKSYTRRTTKVSGGEKRPGHVEKAGLDALKGIERELGEHENRHGTGYLAERANGHTKVNGHANGHANGSAKMNGNSQQRKGPNTEAAVLKDPVLQGGNAIMKTTA